MNFISRASGMGWLSDNIHARHAEGHQIKSQPMTEDYWLIWHKYQRTYAIMNFLLCVIVLIQHHLWTIFLSQAWLQKLHILHICAHMHPVHVHMKY